MGMRPPRKAVRTWSNRLKRGALFSSSLRICRLVVGSVDADWISIDWRRLGAVASPMGGTPSDPMRGEKNVKGTNCVSLALVLLAMLNEMWSNILRYESAYAMAAKGSDKLVENVDWDGGGDCPTFCGGPWWGEDGGVIVRCIELPNIGELCELFRCCVLPVEWGGGCGEGDGEGEDDDEKELFSDAFLLDVLASWGVFWGGWRC